MYSRKENKMAKNIDSFDMDKWSKGRKEKAEKPIKEKKEKETSFDMDDSGSFSMDKHTKKEKKEKVKKEKPLKEDNDTSFAVESKGKFDIKNAFKTKGKDGKSKEVKLDESGEFDALEGTPKKKLKINLKDKKTRLIFIFSIVAILVVALSIVAGVSLFTEIDRQNNTPISISMGSFPKLQYYVGEEADYTGLSVAVKKYNGTVEYVQYSEANASDFTFSGFDASRTYEDRVITVNYKGFTCSYHIIVKEVPKPKPTLVGITIEVMPKTEYKVGEWLDTDGGMLLKHYSDGTTERTILVNNYITDGWEEAWTGGPGTYTLTVKYKEDGSKTVKTTYDITITE